MSRNRVKNAHSLHWAAVLRWIVVVLLISVLGASYVALKNKVLRLASEVNQEEIELGNWQKRNQQIECNIAKVTSFQELQQRLTSLGLGTTMVKISELEIVRMEGVRPESGTAIAQSNVRADSGMGTNIRLSNGVAP